ncbi:sigma factor-like helix-turn-helix DNA-binding protein [Agrococcus versicolor]|uniref:sigma factor-like helix-turn-helix DNA-binding protein n=1 Tax=Agrococcus versicolor TaxID=501482 RepID=UPI0031DBA8BB
MLHAIHADGRPRRAAHHSEQPQRIRVAVWSEYPVAADAVRDCLRRAPAGLDVERLVEGVGDLGTFDVALVLRDELEPGALARLRRSRVPVLQLSDDAEHDGDWLHVLPRRSPLPMIVRSIERIARRTPRPRTIELELSRREAEAVILYASGLQVVAVADELGVGVETVRTYLRRARIKLRARGHDGSTRDRLAELHAFGELRRQAAPAR